MKLRRLSYTLILVATISLIVSGMTIWLGIRQRQSAPQPLVITARPLAQQADEPLTFPLDSQVVVGTPEVGATTIPRYTYRNERGDPNQRRSLYLIDTTTGEERRLGDDDHAALFGAMNEAHLFWFFDGGLHAYELATGQDRLVTKPASYSVHPQSAGEWVTFGNYNDDGSRHITFSVANIQTSEIITLTEELWGRDGMTNEYFGISPQLVAWYDFIYGKPVGISIYDLTTRTFVTQLTNLNGPFGERTTRVYDVAAGETVVTWNGGRGYDLVTQSYFKIPRFEPPEWNKPPIFKQGRITEANRTLYQILELKDGSLLEIRAPLLDATPSTELCTAGQNLVQNGDLEATADHALWQQTDSPSNLIVDELPAGLATSGDWAIRLGRYANSHAAIRQPLEIPSGVSGLTLAFDVRVLSWDFWGGDRLQVDLIDPLTGNSLLATPVQWTNVELASGAWLPMQVIIETWPGINTPLELVFQVQTDWALPTDFIIDNITLTTACQ